MNFIKFNSISTLDEVREMLIASADYSAIANSQDVLPQNSGKRKRNSLNGLSMEEKIRRKKLKNREAAQNSRDKKKAYVTNLEEEISLLRKEKEDLYNKVQELTDEVKQLKEQNEKLQRDYLDASVRRGDDKRSAVPYPQQKEAPPLIALTQLISTLCLILRTSIGSKKLVSQSTSTNYQNLLIVLREKIWNWRLNSVTMKWWGPSQKSWNPLRLVQLLDRRMLI